MIFSNKASIKAVFILFIIIFQSNKVIGINTVNTDSANLVFKAILDHPYKTHRAFYNWMWGKNYQKLYSEPIYVKVISLNSFHGGVTPVKHLPSLYGTIFKNQQKKYYLVKKLDSDDSFLGSTFFRQIYDPSMFKNTYLGNFIDEAYTIKNPFAFLVSDNMAKSVDLNAGNASLYFLEGSKIDSTNNEISIENNLVSFNGFPDLSAKDILVNTEDIVNKVHEGEIRIDYRKYIRLRLFDMLVGDWNQIPENRMWISFEKNDTLLYEPFVLDRSHTFTKVDGVFLQQLFNMLGLDFIAKYNQKLKNVKKFNTLGYPADMALTAMCNENDWIEEAKYLQTALTDSLIDVAFTKFPRTMPEQESNSIKYELKQRKINLEKLALKYFSDLQKVPVITGSDSSEEYLIQNNATQDSLNIQILNTKNQNITFNRNYSTKQTKEIWLYPFGGNNSFSINKNTKKIPLLIIGSTGNSSYQITEAKGVKIYTTKEEKQSLDTLKSEIKITSPSDKSVLDYDFGKNKYSKLGLTPIGVYDSDLGLNIGTSLTYTIYGFKRSPYTQQHQLSYNYSSGLIYQGIFPDYDSKKSFHLSAFLGDMAYFSNFFGFGNETSMHKHEKRTFNRVHIKKATITPAFYYNLNKNQEFNIYTSLQTFKVVNPKDRDRYINEVFLDDNEVFKRKFFLDLGVTYTYEKKINSFISKLKFVLNPGWTLNIAKPGVNFPYLDVDLGINLKLTNRLTLATIVNGKAIFSDKYEFYQSASAQLRGFRNNRFIGRQSLYEYTDLRLDMGRLQNPLTPIEYGFFVGIDHGRVWHPDESSTIWHTSYGGGFWLTLFKQFTGKFSHFTSKDDNRFTFGLGMSF